MDEETVFISIIDNKLPVTVWFNRVDVSKFIFEVELQEGWSGNTYKLIHSPHNIKVFDSLSKELDAERYFNDDRWESISTPPGEDRLIHYCLSYLRVPERHAHVIKSYTNQSFRILLENE